MLTKSDLQAIKEIVDERLDSRLDEKLKPVSGRFDQIEKRLGSIEEQVKPIKRMATNVRRIRKDLDYVIGTYNEEIVYTRRRVEIIEKHLKLPTIEKPSSQN